MLVSMLVEDILIDFGCTVVGTAARLKDAVEMARTCEIDVALLDINLGGNRSFPVADILAERGVPFVFASGYAGNDEVFMHFPEVRVVAKPYSGSDLIEAVSSVLSPERRLSGV